MSEQDNVLIQEAFSQIRMWQSRIDENKSVELQVFLLSNPAQTKFIKDTDGGMYQSKK